MRIKRPRDHDGTAGKPGSQFTGDVFPYITMAQTDGVAEIDPDTWFSWTKVVPPR